MVVNLQLQNIALPVSETNEKERQTILYKSYFSVSVLFIDESSKDERATRIL